MVTVPGKATKNRFTIVLDIHAPDLRGVLAEIEEPVNPGSYHNPHTGLRIASTRDFMVTSLVAVPFSFVISFFT